MLTLTIDDKLIQATPGTTVLEAALANGIDIPRLCYHPGLKPSGGCRLCIVEVEGRPNPTAACGLECADGLAIRTHTPALEALRRDVVDLFLADHPLTCVTCDKNGACDLQTYAYRYNLAETSHQFELSRTLYQDDNPFFLRDHQYCILCGKCARVCDEIVGVNAIEYAGRGFHSHIATPFDGPMIDSSCVFCGSCVQVCPTAALLPMSRLRQGREWEFERRRTVCGYCGVGCSLEYALKDGKIVYAQGFPEAPVNGEYLCTKGRFGWDFISSPERLTRPLIRKDVAYALGLTDQPWSLPADSVLPPAGANGQKRPPGPPARPVGQAPRATGEGDPLDWFVPVPWETALDFVAARLSETVKAHGPDAVAGLASARCTNEENYVFQKMLRATLGTNNLDHCARL